jgi:hypothetical protein
MAHENRWFTKIYLLKWCVFSYYTSYWWCLLGSAGPRNGGTGLLFAGPDITGDILFKNVYVYIYNILMAYSMVQSWLLAAYLLGSCCQYDMSVQKNWLSTIACAPNTSAFGAVGSSFSFWNEEQLIIVTSRCFFFHKCTSGYYQQPGRFFWYGGTQGPWQNRSKWWMLLPSEQRHLRKNFVPFAVKSIHVCDGSKSSTSGDDEFLQISRFLWGFRCCFFLRWALAVMRSLWQLWAC